MGPCDSSQRRPARDAEQRHDASRLSDNGSVSALLAGVPPVKSTAAQGLHDVVLDPDFSRNRTIYFTYFAPPRGQAAATWPITHFYEDVWTKPFAERRTMDLGTERVARAKLSDDFSALTDVEVLAEGVERNIVLAPDGTIFVLGADRFRFYDSDLDGVNHDFTDNPDIRRNFTGRVIRINRDGSIPKDNPWLNRATVLRETFAHGLKDPEGAAIHPQTQQLWAVDHGPQGGDEINIIRAGRDYGWPDVSYGTQYDARQPDGEERAGRQRGEPEGRRRRADLLLGAVDRAVRDDVYTGDLFPDWKGNLFVGSMSAQHGHQLVRLVLNGDRVVAEEKLLADRKGRIRFMRQAPDGSIYVIAGSDIWRLTPRSRARPFGRAVSVGPVLRTGHLLRPQRAQRLDAHRTSRGNEAAEQGCRAQDR